MTTCVTAALLAAGLFAAGPARAADPLPLPEPAPAIPSSALAAPAVMPEPAATVYTESSLRRAESVFFISLPFCALYSAVLSVGAAFAIEGRRIRIDDRVWISTASLAALASGYITWKDHRSLPPP